MIEGDQPTLQIQTLKKISSIVNIENHKIDYKIFNNLAYNQWNIKEIESGEAWENISKIKLVYFNKRLILKLITILSSFEIFFINRMIKVTWK